MMKSHFNRLWRKAFGRYSIDDPRPIAEAAPYTYHLPSENELLALDRGDLAKLIVRSIPPSFEWDAERMWVTVVVVNGDNMIGELANRPSDMPQLHIGSRIAFTRGSVIDIEWQENRATTPPSAPDRRWYWERCLVDRCVTDDRILVEYLYREAPDPIEEGDQFEDSGWRIRGDARGVSDDELDKREAEYVAVGRVLNCDDSWLALIDQPAGSAFMRNWTTGAFERSN